MCSYRVRQLTTLGLRVSGQVQHTCHALCLHMWHQNALDQCTVYWAKSDVQKNKSSSHVVSDHSYDLLPRTAAHHVAASKQ